MSLEKRMEYISNAFPILIGKGALTKKDFPEIDSLTLDYKLYEDLEKFCLKSGLKLFSYYSENDNETDYYVSPIPGSGPYTYNNEDLRAKFKNGFSNEDLYMALFIIAMLVVAFFPDASEPGRRFINMSELINMVDERVNSLLAAEPLEKISQENSYNFSVVAKKWSELQKVKFSSEDRQMREGKSSKVQMTRLVLRFLKEEGLIELQNPTEDDPIIRITDHFKGTALTAYNQKDIQEIICAHVESMRDERNNI